MVEVHSGDKKKELGKRDKGGKMVTDRPTDDDHGGTKQKLFLRRQDGLFSSLFSGEAVRSSPPPAHTHQCHHCIGKSRSLSSVCLSGADLNISSEYGILY